jgi:hypothetical protein
MNIINLYNKPLNLFAHMHNSLKRAGVDFEHSVRIAKTVAPLLQDQSSNERHLEVIKSDAPTKEKVIAIIMLGFPKNRFLLPILRDILLGCEESLAIAASIAISQMKDGQNNEMLADILTDAYHITDSEAVKKSIKKNLLGLVNHKSALYGLREQPTVF